VGTKHEKVDAYIEKANPFAKPILTHLRKLVHKACPGVEENVKWSFPVFEYKGIMCNMVALKEYCGFGFWKASIMADSHKLFAQVQEPAMGQLGKIRTKADLPPDDVLMAYIKEAAQLNEAGVKVPAKKKASPTDELAVPGDFLQVLTGNKTAEANFTAFSFSKRKDYLQWFDEAKTIETRSKRMATAVEWLAENKSRNWKYEKK
jgi:uncharacterized protein YdeI (YjbR/CyaY-like superfamily)